MPSLLKSRKLSVVTHLGNGLDKKYLFKVIQLYSVSDEDARIF